MKKVKNTIIASFLAIFLTLGAACGAQANDSATALYKQSEVELATTLAQMTMPDAATREAFIFGFSAEMKSYTNAPDAQLERWVTEVVNRMEISGFFEELRQELARQLVNHVDHADLRAIMVFYTEPPQGPRILAAEINGGIEISKHVRRSEAEQERILDLYFRDHLSEEDYQHMTWFFETPASLRAEKAVDAFTQSVELMAARWFERNQRAVDHLVAKHLSD